MNTPCVLILGTNADDDITVIARDASYSPLADGIRDFTVSINGGPEILYIDVGGTDAGPGITITGDLFIDGLAGDDDIVFRTPAPNGAQWSMHVHVAGGTPSAVTGDQGDVLELETPGHNNVLYTPTGSDSGIILIDTGILNDVSDVGDTLITMGTFTNACPSSPTAQDGYNSSPGGIEQFVYDGEAGNDVLTVVGDRGQPMPENDRFVHTPGTAIDSGRVDDLNTTVQTTLLSVNYQNLGQLGTISVYGGGITETDTLVALGTGDSDRMDVIFPATNEINIRLFDAAGTHIALTSEGVESYELRTLEGDDEISLFGGMAATGTIRVFAGEPSASDVVNFAGSGNAITVSFVFDSVQETGFAPVFLSGVEVLDVIAAGGDLTVTGTIGDDVIDVSSDSDTGGDVGTVRLVSSTEAHEDTPVVNGFGVGTFFIGNVTGDDNLRYIGTADDDNLYINVDPINLGFINVDPIEGPTFHVSNLFSTITYVGGAGDDELKIDNTFGLVELPNGIVFEGGTGRDSIFLIGFTPVDTVTYTPGPNPDEGEISQVSVENGTRQLVFFTGLEPIFDDVRQRIW